MNRNDQQFMAQKIRTQYMEKTPAELDALRSVLSACLLVHTAYAVYCPARRCEP